MSIDNRDRIADMTIGLHDFMDLLRSMDGKTTFTVDGLPRDAEIVAATFDWQRNAFTVRFRSKEFCIVPPGDVVPRFDARIRANRSGTPDGVPRLPASRSCGAAARHDQYHRMG